MSVSHGMTKLCFKHRSRQYLLNLAIQLMRPHVQEAVFYRRGMVVDCAWRVMLRAVAS